LGLSLKLSKNNYKYYFLVNKCSPTRKALAIIVNEGFTAALEGKKLPSNLLLPIKPVKIDELCCLKLEISH
jgi:hypothetical protein